MADKKESEKRHVVVSNFEMWAARICVLAILCLSGWVTKEFHYSQVSLNNKITRVEQELDVTKPKDVLEALEESNEKTHSKIDKLNDKILSKEDVRSIIMDHSPWPLVEKDWETWRLRIEKDLIEIRQDLNKIKMGEK